MLQEPDRLLLHELGNHVAQDGPDSVKAFVGMANVRETDVVKKDLLNDENGDRLAELGARLHDPQA